VDLASPYDDSLVRLHRTCLEAKNNTVSKHKTEMEMVTFNAWTLIPTYASRLTITVYRGVSYVKESI